MKINNVKLKNIETLIFDVDGTLIDATKDIVKAMNHTLFKLGLAPKRPEAIISYVGTGVKDLLRKTLERNDHSHLVQAEKIFGEYYVEHSADEARIYPHVEEVLEHFKDKTKYVLTNRKSVFAKASLDKLGLSKYFDDILGADEEGCLKPSTCPIDRHQKASKIDKKKAIMIGDMDIDVITGKRAGMRTCWVTYGLGKKEIVLPLKPDIVIDDMIELKNLIS